MQKILFSILLLSFLFACAHKHQRISITPQCRHTSVFYALAFGEKYPVRIVFGEVWFGQHAECIISDVKTQLVDGKIEPVDLEIPWILVYENGDNVPIERAIKWSTKRFKSL